MKDCALRLWESGWDEHDICAALLVSRRSLYRWRAIFDTFGAVKRPSSPLIGRTRIITRAVLTAVHHIYATNPDTYIDELVWWLAIHHDIVISPSTLHRNLQEAGLTRKLLRKLAYERDEALRLDWRQFVLEHGEGYAREFVVVDETSKNDHSTARHYGYALSGERAELVDVFVRGDCYSLVAAMTVTGYIAAQVVPGPFDAMSFYDFIAEEVVCAFHISACSMPTNVVSASPDESLAR
jgi:transposase